MATRLQVCLPLGNQPSAAADPTKEANKVCFLKVRSVAAEELACQETRSQASLTYHHVSHNLFRFDSGTIAAHTGGSCDEVQHLLPLQNQKAIAAQLLLVPSGKKCCTSSQEHTVVFESP